MRNVQNDSWANRIRGWLDAEWAKFDALRTVASVGKATMSRILNGHQPPKLSHLKSWRDCSSIDPRVREQCAEAIAREAGTAELVGNPDADGDGDVDWDDYRILQTRKLHLSAEAIELTTGNRVDHARVERNRTEQTITDRTAGCAFERINQLSPSARVTAGRFSPHTAGASSHGAPAPANRKGTR